MESNFEIPSMGGGALKDLFFVNAKEATDGSAIVELGTWLGAGTKHIADGVKASGNNVEIHTYDDFIIRGNEVQKAAKFGVKVEANKNCLPLVKKFLSAYNNIIFHKGEITKTEWNKKPIHMYIDDACKYEENFIKALKIFSPYWIPGKTIIVLMDFYFYLLRSYDEGLKFQFDFIKSHSDNFKPIIKYEKLCTAVFLYKGGLKL